MSSYFEFAISLRKGNKYLPDNRAGWYKWYADEESIKNMLSGPYSSLCYGGKTLTYYDILFKDYISSFERRTFDVTCQDDHDRNMSREYYGIYVGVAYDQSLQDRVVGNHINGNGASTLRNSISCLLTGKKGDDKATDAFIDRLIVTAYTEDNHTMGSDAAKKDLEMREKREINAKISLLNIEENDYPNPVFQCFWGQLRCMISK